MHRLHCALAAGRGLTGGEMTIAVGYEENAPNGELAARSLAERSSRMPISPSSMRDRRARCGRLLWSFRLWRWGH